MPSAEGHRRRGDSRRRLGEQKLLAAGSSRRSAFDRTQISGRLRRDKCISTRNLMASRKPDAPALSKRGAGGSRRSRLRLLRAPRRRSRCWPARSGRLLQRGESLLVQPHELRQRLGQHKLASRPLALSCLPRRRASPRSAVSAPRLGSTGGHSGSARLDNGLDGGVVRDRVGFVSHDDRGRNRAPGGTPSSLSNSS